MTLHPTNAGAQTPEQFANALTAMGYQRHPNGSTWMSAGLAEKPAAETAIPIQARPTPSRGPVADFRQAVQDERGSYRTNQLYAFGPVLVRFYANGNAMDHFKPIAGKPGAYLGTRITSTGRRINLGTQG